MARRLFTLITTGLFSVLIHACDTPPPFEQLHQTSQTLIDHRDLSYHYAEKHFLPYIDVAYITQFIMGRYQWQKTSESDKNKLIESFKKALVKLYAKNIHKKNRNIEFSKDKFKASETSATLLGTATEKNKAKIIIGVYFHCRDNTWKLYDISVDNVHIIEQLKLQYATTVRHKGAKGLIEELNKFNT
ncbi:MAG: ABC transporter substrate-binding protein [Pseudomonadota bacterium]|nr:ABC transporter substrate-binding protein [Pseudomonadota bacterium]